MKTQKFSIVGTNPFFQKTVEQARHLSSSKVPVLINGEIGTGKKLLAQFIHSQSARSEKAFYIVDCSKDPKEVENKILGHREESGRFVKGVLELGNGGTVVLDNIDALEEEFQKRLYAIINELNDYDLDVRLIACSSKNLSKFVGAGRFYRALYIFFSKTTLGVLPLRERKDDLVNLCHYFIQSYCLEQNIAPVELSQDALSKISDYYWTHNIKELKGVLIGAIQNAQNGIIDINAIEVGEKKVESTRGDEEDDGIRLMSLKDAEKVLIKKALIHTSENRTQAAKILGVSIRTLRNKINEYRTQGASFFVNLR